MSVSHGRKAYGPICLAVVAAMGTFCFLRYRMGGALMSAGFPCILFEHVPYLLIIASKL
jgi:hypothetical protein